VVSPAANIDCKLDGVWNAHDDIVETLQEDVTRSTTNDYFHRGSFFNWVGVTPEALGDVPIAVLGVQHFGTTCWAYEPVTSIYLNADMQWGFRVQMKDGNGAALAESSLGAFQSVQVTYIGVPLP